MAMDDQIADTMIKSYLTNSDVGRVHEEQKVEYEECDNYQGIEEEIAIKRPARTSFLKGIRRDVNAYKDFKEDRYYDSWIKSVQANAHLHGVGLVLDPDYIPRGADAIEDFKEMQTYMWAIVVNTVKTSSGKQFIRQHDKDPQTVFAKLHQELKQSQKAEHSADDLYDTIKALSLNTWQGSYVSFLEHWSSQLYVWCELVAGTRTEPEDTEKKKMLKTSVSTASVMASIGNQETIEIAKGYDKWTYDHYYNILMKAAIDDDRAKKRTSRSTKTKAQINKAERKANSATQGHGGRGGGRGRGRDGRNSRGARGDRGGRGDRNGGGGEIPS
jgi:hypothetical protein